MKNDVDHSGHPEASSFDEDADQRNKAQPKQARTMTKKEGEERKRHEPLIHEKNEFNEILDIIFSDIHFLMAYMDRDFNFIRVNVAYAQASGGQQPSFFIGKNHFELFPDEENEAIFREVVETGEPYQAFAKPFEYPDDPERGVTYWDWTLHPLKGTDGRVHSLILILIDVTERMKAEVSSREGKVLLESVFESLEEVVFVISPEDRTIIMCNSAMESIFGYAVEEVIGRNTAFLHVNDAMYRKFGRELLSALEKGETYHTQFQLKRKDGSIFPTDHTVKEILDLSGNRISLVSVIRDLTDQKDAEEALRMYLKELERSNIELENFAYVASHDLQEPLRKIQTFGDRLATKYTDRLEPSARDYLERMLNAAKRMRGLINALLDFSRVHTKSSPFQDVNLMKVTDEARSNLEFRIEKTQGTLEIGDLPAIEADHHQMVQLMQNLISNALKFHKEERPPRVIITGELIDRYKGRKREGLPSGRLCRISVEDDGIGFDEAYLERIFAPFQRLHGRSQYEGVGMGLAICRKIVERHRGVITARSEPGKGSAFTVILPVIQTRKK